MYALQTLQQVTARHHVQCIRKDSLMQYVSDTVGVAQEALACNTSESATGDAAWCKVHLHQSELRVCLLQGIMS